MKVVYVAGPFRAANSWEIEQNVRWAEELALEVWRLGAAAICPHTNSRFYQWLAGDSVWLEGDLEILRRCDAVIMCKGWEKPANARAENREAINCGIRVFHDPLNLERWLHEKFGFECQTGHVVWELDGSCRKRSGLFTARSGEE